MKMDIVKGVKLAKNILNNSPYGTQKDKLKELFNDTKNEDRGDVLLRLIVIDSCYSTNMNKRLFGFKELTEFIVKEIEPKIKDDFDAHTFIVDNFSLLKDKKIGIDKNGVSKGHAFSLITKYLFFRTGFNFPIFDSLVFIELTKQDQDLRLPVRPLLKYFEKLNIWKKKYGMTWDDLDQYFWVCGKVRKGSFSLLLNDKESYNNLLDILNIIQDSKLESKEIDNSIRNRLKSNDLFFKEEKMKDIHKLFLMIVKNS